MLLLYLLCWGFFITNRCWSFSVAFSVSIDVIMSFILHLLIWCITLMDLQILDHFSIPEVSSAWSWCIIFLMYCWIQFANILVSISDLCTLGVLAFNFLLVVSLSCFGRIMLCLLYTLIKLYYTKALSDQVSSLAPDWILLLLRPRIPASLHGSATTFQ